MIPSVQPESGHRANRTSFVILIAVLALLGLVARLRTAAFPAAEMFRSFPSEDGYLMLTVARNLSLGRGMTIAAGTVPTNGVQPLATFMQATIFWLVGGDRTSGVRLLLIVYTLVAVVTAVLIYHLGLYLLGPTEEARRASLLGAAMWFTSPVTLFHSMNMLETGLYAAAVVTVSLFFLHGHARTGASWSWFRCIVLGLLLGVAFWARNDAAILMAAVGLSHLATVGQGANLRRRFAETGVMAIGAVAASLPWLLYNLWDFGSVVPVSGLVHLHPGDMAANLRAASVALFEHATLVASFAFNPVQYSSLLVAFCAATLVLATVGVATGLMRSQGFVAQSSRWLVPLFFGAGLLIFYVLFFDAPYFVRRYLFPVSPFLALLWGWAALRLWRRLATPRLRFARPVLPAVLIGSFFVQDGLMIRGPWRRGVVFRCVEWVDGNVPEENWVGAFQSGTLGFFHDRTINLDGKVNPQALAAIQRGRHQAYVVGSPVEFVADWATILEPWSRSDPIVLRHFEWRVFDADGNFAVLVRRDSSRPGTPHQGG